MFGQEPAPVRPRAGKVQIFKEADLKTGMKGYAWTVLQGTEPEALPVEILGIYKNQWGPKQDVILAKLGGKGQRTNVAAGMSGSPVYIDGKLVGAIALRFSTFSPDALCGITPIELMLEVNDFDDSRPSNARTPDKGAAHNAAAAGFILASRRFHRGIPIRSPSPAWFPSKPRSTSPDSMKTFCPSLRPIFSRWA